MTGALRVERQDGRVIATLDRLAVRNAIDRATADAFHELCAELEAEPRILIITGSDGVFASGADIAELRERTAEDARAGHQRQRVHPHPQPADAGHRGRRWLGAWAAVPSSPTPPTSGIATPAARFGQPEPGLGIIAAAGASWRLKRDRG